MQYNPGDGSGIVDEIDDLCDSDATKYPIAKKTRRVNSALETLVGLIINADGTWQWDDTNNTTTPIGTGTLVEGQSAYSFQGEFLDIENIKIKDINGHWQIIEPIDQSQTDTALEEYLLVNAFPQYYDKDDDTIRLYPAPSASVVTLASGIKVQFKRTASLFTTGDTTKVPGIASPYHPLVAYMASIPYCMSYKKDRVPLYEKKVMEMKKDMILFYSRRERDKRKVMSSKPISFR